MARSQLETIEQRAWREDGDVVGCQIEEVGVAGDQQVGLAASVQRDEVIVLGIDHAASAVTPGCGP